MTPKTIRKLICGGLVWSSLGCAPKVILIDRDHFLEQEANGDWPDYEAQVRKALLSVGPMPLDESALSERRKRAVLLPPGELK